MYFLGFDFQFYIWIKIIVNWLPSSLVVSTVVAFVLYKSTQERYTFTSKMYFSWVSNSFLSISGGRGFMKCYSQVVSWGNFHKQASFSKFYGYQVEQMWYYLITWWRSIQNINAIIIWMHTFLSQTKHLFLKQDVKDHLSRVNGFWSLM